MKRLLAVAAALVGVVVLAGVGLALFFPTERATTFAVEKIEAATGRPVAIADTKVSIFPRATLALDGVTFGDVAAPGAPRIAAAEVRLGLKLVPLIQKRVEVKELKLVRPEIEVVLNEEAARVEKASKSGSGGAVDVTIDRFIVEDGTVTVRMPDGSPMVVVTGLDQELSAKATAAGDLTLSGVTRSDNLLLTLANGQIGEGLSPSLTTELAYRAGDDRLDVTKATLDLAGVPVEVSGHIGAIASRDFVADLALDGGPGDVATILGLLPSGLFPQIQGMSSAGRMKVTGSVTGPLTTPGGPAFDLALALDEGRIQYPGFAQAIEAIKLDLTASPDTIVVREFAATAGGNALRAHASVTDYRAEPRLTLAFDGELDLDRLDEFYPTPEGVEVGGKLVAQGICEGLVREPSKMRLNGTATATDFRVQNSAMRVPLHGFSGDLVFDRDRVTTTRLTGKLGSSDLTVSGEVMNPIALIPAVETTRRAVGDVDVRSARLNLDELMAPETETGEGAVAAAANDVIQLPELPRLDGVMRLAADELRLNRVETKNATGRLTLDQGIFGVEKAVFQAFAGAVQLDGTMDLNQRVRPTFDMKTVVENAAIDQLIAYSESFERFNLLGSNLTGAIDIDAEMEGGLTDALRLDIPTLISKGKLHVDEAQIAGHPIQDKLSTFLKTEGVENLVVSQLAQQFTIENGRLILDELNVVAGSLEVMGEGSTSFDGQYTLNLGLFLPEDAATGVRDLVSPDVAAMLFGGTGGRVMIPVVLKGERAKAPDVALDQARLSAEAQRRAKERLEAEKQKLLEDAQQGVIGAVTGALGAPPDSTAPPNPVKEVVETKVKDALKGIFGKKK